MRKCYACLCKTCIKVCCSRKECLGKKKECKAYCGFEQLSIFDEPPKAHYPAAPRYSLKYYGISRERCRELKAAIQSGGFADMVRSAAYAANEDIAEHLIKSVVENKSYDALKIKWELKEIDRIPCGRTDFYGYRRKFYHIFDGMYRKERSG